MSSARVKNWEQFQHYKDRSPPWIKLHRGLLDDFNFSSLPIASKALAPLLWLLAAETTDGTVSTDPEFLAFRLRWRLSDVNSGLTPLIEKGFLIVASNPLAGRLQVATPERETEGERETEAEGGKTAGAVGPEQVVAAYHHALPACQRIAVLTPERRTIIRKAETNARRVCQSRGWTYGPDFWTDYFAECAKDPWMRGEVANPKNAAWKQSLDVLLKDKHFAAVMDRALGGGA